MNITIVVHTFQKDSFRGSPQYLHFFTEEKKCEEEYLKFIVQDEFDHSFIYLKNSQYAIVYWKNKAGPIQFCGSAAYALTWIMNQYGQSHELKIFSKNIQIDGFEENKKTYLQIPNSLPTFFSTKTEGDLHCFVKSGIYFLMCKGDIQTKDSKWVKNFVNQERLENVHGLCLFKWNKTRREGEVRYFTPWHGRDEDYVTGSIHQHLTPLVDKLYSAKKQTWIQRSTYGGQLLSELIDKGGVHLNGQCSSRLLENEKKFLGFFKNI